MNTHFPSAPASNRSDEESLQKTFEAMLAEIKRMKLDEDEKKKLITLLINYRTAWNSYMNSIKPRKSQTTLSSSRIKRREARSRE